MFYALSISNDPATPQIYTLSLHDALPISLLHRLRSPGECGDERHVRRRADVSRCGAAVAHRRAVGREHFPHGTDRKSTRLNSSHRCISYAVFCLKKKSDTRGTGTVVYAGV